MAGIKLPEFGITEAIQKIVSPQSSYTAQGGSNLIGGSKAYSSSVPSTSNQMQSSGSVLGDSSTVYGPAYNGPVAKSTGTGAQAPVSQPVAPTNNIQDQLNVGNNQIDLDYNSYLNDLSAQENQYRGEASAAESAINTQADRARTQFAQEKAAKEQGLGDYETSANKAYTSAMQQARDIARQAQQQNIAQLSAQGLSSSSVAEALAEKLGVETARRVSEASGSLADVVTNINKERKTLGEYYQSKLSQLEQDVTSNIGQIRSQLLSGIDALNRARNVAASERAQRRQQLLVDAQSSIAQIQQQAQAYQQALSTWSAQKDASLTEVGKNLPQIWANYTQGLQRVTQSLPAGLEATPSFSIDNNGNVIPTSVNVSKAKKEDLYGTDPLLSQYGL